MATPPDEVASSTLQATATTLPLPIAAPPPTATPTATAELLANMAISTDATPTPTTVEDFRDYSRSGIHSSYLHEQTVAVKQRTIDWDTYQRANILTVAQVQTMQRFDAKLAQVVLQELVLQEGPLYLSVLLECLVKIVRVDTVQYLLALLDDALYLLLERPDVMDAFLQTYQSQIYPLLWRLLEKDDEYSQLKSAKLICELLSYAGSFPTQEWTQFLRWIYAQLANFSQKPNPADVALQCLQCLLRHSSLRAPIAAHQQPPAIASLLELWKKHSLTPQTQYQVMFCMWMWSFVPEVAATLQQQHDLLSVLVDVLKTALKEKLIRVTLSTMRNLYEKAQDAALLPMVGHKVRATCETLLQRKWSDEDIRTDLEFLRAELDLHIQKLSTWDEYNSELRSGKLEWSPVHTSEHFWKHNAQRLNEKDYELLRTLGRLLVTSTSAVVLAVACHDIGQYAKYYPQGKKYISDLGAKQQVMELMTHENSEVRYHALAAVQNYMANAWDF